MKIQWVLYVFGMEMCSFDWIIEVCINKIEQTVDSTDILDRCEYFKDMIT